MQRKTPGILQVGHDAPAGSRSSSYVDLPEAVLPAFYFAQISSCDRLLNSSWGSKFHGQKRSIPAYRRNPIVECVGFFLLYKEHMFGV